MGVPGTGAAKRVVLETLGWTLLVVGVAALVLPGPGLLAIFAGLALLSQQYDWAQKRVDPVRRKALQAAAEGVETWVRIAASCIGVLLLLAAGALWIVGPAEPAWWPFPSALWLPGGLGTGVTQVVSAAIAFSLIIYSYRRFHGKPEAVAEVKKDPDEADANSRADMR